jgi:small-conductance mechanosensitive channel
VDPLARETLDQAAQNAVQELSRVVTETRESRNVSAMLRSAGLAALATTILLVLVWILRRVRGWLAERIMPLAEKKSSQLRVGGEAIFHGEWVLGVVSWVLAIIYWFLILLLLYEWLGYILARFPYTRPMGERLMQYLFDVVTGIAGSMLSSIPKLLIALIIFLIAKAIVNILRSIFDRVEQGQISVSWLDHDTVRPTRRLVSAAVWLFALAMAYPYLPGAQTEAFKGLSVLIGLMISLGASSLVGQAASGLILMFTRTMRSGEYVSINDKEGTVVELGLFTTRIRNGLGEELTMPNSLILGTVTKNYSRMVHGPGFILSTTVTIGYDTPWRQIHAMLLEAARRTAGVLEDPPPRVFQLALSDYYPEYRLVCQAIPTTPLPRAEVLTALHANIQDVFNEYGVQIMSPHYMTDPAEAKVVAEQDWFAAPAAPPGGREL